MFEFNDNDIKKVKTEPEIQPKESADNMVSNQDYNNELIHTRDLEQIVCGINPNKPPADHSDENERS